MVFKSDKIFVSHALEGETVLLEPIDDEQRFFDIYFLDFHIGTLDALYSTTKSVTIRGKHGVSDVPGLIGYTQEKWCRQQGRGEPLA